MIPVREFVGLSSTWNSVAPTLEQVVRWANTHLESLGTAVPSRSAAERNSLLAELAFEAAAAGFDEIVWRDGSWRTQSVQEFISNLPGGKPALADVTATEWNEVRQLARPLGRYLALLDSPTARPAVPGCGVIDAAFADICTEQELVEVKTVTRPFRSVDLRQALTYVAMFFASGVRFERVVLLNPRRAKYAALSLEFIAQSSSGRSAPELLRDLINEMLDVRVSG